MTHQEEFEYVEELIKHRLDELEQMLERRSELRRYFEGVCSFKKLETKDKKAEWCTYPRLKGESYCGMHLNMVKRAGVEIEHSEIPYIRSEE